MAISSIIGTSRSIASSPTRRNLSAAQKALEKGMERISSGKRVNSAKDDAASLAIAKQLLSELDSQQVVSRNIEDGFSVADVADGALGSQGELVSRMRELAVQASNGTLSDANRSAIQSEFDQLRSEFDRIGGSTEFNGKKLLDGESTSVQVGTGGSDDNRIELGAVTSNSTALGFDTLDLSSASGAQNALDGLDGALENISTQRSNIGAVRNRLDAALEENAVSMENIAAAASRLADADIAAESTELALNKVREAMGTRLSKHEGVSAGLLVDLVA